MSSNRVTPAAGWTLHKDVQTEAGKPDRRQEAGALGSPRGPASLTTSMTLDKPFRSFLSLFIHAFGQLVFQEVSVEHLLCTLCCVQRAQNKQNRLASDSGRCRVAGKTDMEQRAAKIWSDNAGADGAGEAERASEGKHSSRSSEAWASCFYENLPLPSLL